MWGNVIAAGAGAAFTLIFSLIEQMKQKQEEARQKAIQLTEEYDHTRESLQELTREYTSLKQTLDSGGLSYDEEIEAKKELLAIQEKLVEMFGSEANGLDLVNGKLEDQTDQIEKLSVAQAKKYLQDTFKSGQDAEKVLNEEDINRPDLLKQYHRILIKSVILCSKFDMRRHFRLINLACYNRRNHRRTVFITYVVLYNKYRSYTALLTSDNRA